MKISTILLFIVGTIVLLLIGLIVLGILAGFLIGGQDDQRLKDLSTHMRTIESDMDALSDYRADMDADIDAWNSARTNTERMRAYKSYSTNARLYANKLDGTIVHIDNFIAFLTKNKAYLDSKGMDTQSNINEMITIKTNLKGQVIQIQSNLQTMEENLALEAQEQQELNTLIDMFIKLGLGLG